MAFEVNSVPWSETTIPGLPRRRISIDSSRTTRLPEIDVSGIAAKHSRVTSSTKFENAEPPAAGELVMHEVQRPARIRLCFDKDRRPRSNRAAAGAALAHREPFFAIKPVDAVLARTLAFLAQ